MIPAIIFLQGSGGSQFFPQCKYFANRGMVALTAQFRVRIMHKTTQKYYEQLSDGKSAIRYIRSHALDFRIDPNKIVVVGASQGSIVALCSALIEGLETDTEDLSISSEPNALILLSPPIPYLKYITEFTHKRKSKEITPIHEVRKKIPPTILLHSLEDLVPLEIVKEFTRIMRNDGNDCELFVFEGKEHGFIKRGRSEHKRYDNNPYEQSLDIMDKFLVKLGYI